jgi:DNA-binding Lrp family transcriptional regulator
MLVPEIMDSIDKQILSIINKGLPISEQPYLSVAREVGISEQEVIDRVYKLHDSGIIRRTGAVIDPRSLGWLSTLCAADVPPARLDEFAALVNGYEEVTHNYLREGHPNCWFTVIAPSEDRLRGIIAEISQKTGIELRAFPARKVFKIRVKFDLP